jgi:hypothetical protein
MLKRGDSLQNSQNYKGHVREEGVRRQNSEVRMNSEGFYSVSVSCLLNSFFPMCPLPFRGFRGESILVHQKTAVALTQS